MGGGGRAARERRSDGADTLRDERSRYRPPGRPRSNSPPSLPQHNSPTPIFRSAGDSLRSVLVREGPPGRMVELVRRLHEGRSRFLRSTAPARRPPDRPPAPHSPRRRVSDRPAPSGGRSAPPAPAPARAPPGRRGARSDRLIQRLRLVYAGAQHRLQVEADSALSRGDLSSCLQNPAPAARAQELRAEAPDRSRAPKCKAATRAGL